MDPIPYGRQSVDAADVERVTEVLTGDWLTQGPAVAAFEDAVAERCDAPHAVAFSSGTAALHGAAFAAGVGEGDTLLTSALTFAASANCGVYQGADPAFADIDPGHAEHERGDGDDRPREGGGPGGLRRPARSGGRDPRRGGRRGDADLRLVALARARATPDGRPVGCCDHVDMTTFSFHPVKPVTTAEGGIVTTRSEEQADRLRRFRSHGFEREGLRRTDQGAWYHEQHDLGFNYRLSDVHSALGLSQLERLDEFVQRRNGIAQRYRDGLGGVVELPPAAPEGGLHGYHLFVIRHPERRRLYDALRAEGILVQVHYMPVYWHPYYMDRWGFEEGLCPEAEALLPRRVCHCPASPR